MRDLLRVDDLHVRFAAPGRFIQAVRGVSFRIRPGSTVALVGESGSGKSVVSQSIMRILPRNGEITRGAILFADPRGTGEPVDLSRMPADAAAPSRFARNWPTRPPSAAFAPMNPRLPCHATRST